MKRSLCPNLFALGTLCMGLSIFLHVHKKLGFGASPFTVPFAILGMAVLVIWLVTTWRGREQCG